MFDEIKKYKNNGHFFFQKGDTLSEVSREVPELPGVYYILRLAKGKVELVYIGRSGTINQNGKLNGPLLQGSINKKPDGMRRQEFFEQKMHEEYIDGLDIYWFVTMDKANNDLPGYVEGLLMQTYFEMNGQLPAWNQWF
jgi:hypothetical protein